MRANTPMPSIMEVEEPPSEENEQEQQQKLLNQPIPVLPTQQQSKARKMNGMWIGSKHNNAKVASRKRMTKLINAQAENDRQDLLAMPKQKVTCKTPNSRKNPQLKFYAPSPKELAPSPVQTMQ